MKDPFIIKLPYEDMGKFFTDFNYRASKLYFIRDINRNIVSYKPNRAQQIIHNIIKEERQRSEYHYKQSHAYLMYLKSRRMGMSTDTMIRNMDSMLFTNRCNVQVIAHDDFGTEIIYGMYKRCFNSLPDFVEFVDKKGQVVVEGGEKQIFPIKPTNTVPVSDKIEFGAGTFSFLSVFTAGKGDMGGKAGSLNCVHFSEVANFRYYSELIPSTTQQMEGDFQFGVKESTPNGMTGVGEAFYKDYTSNKESWNEYERGRTSTFEGWRPVFLPWYVANEDARLPLVGGKKIYVDDIFDTQQKKNGYVDWEEWVETEVIPGSPYMQDVDCDPREFTNWYRQTVKRKCDNSIETARRYYPTTEEEAFMSTDDCYFDQKKIYQISIDLKEQRNTGNYQYVTGYLDEENNFIENRSGFLYIKSFPEQGWVHRYIIGNDQSEGFEGGDFQNISVFDRLQREFVANYRSLDTETDIAYILMKIGYFYNQGFLIPESNRQTVINIVKPGGLNPYLGDIYSDKIGKRRGRTRNRKYGYNMNTATRGFALERYRKYLYDAKTGEDNYPYTIFFEESADEHAHFIRHIREKRTYFSAAEQHTDDIVISNALCIVGDELWDVPVKIDENMHMNADISSTKGKNTSLDSPDSIVNRAIEYSDFKSAKRETIRLTKKKFSKLGM